MYHWSYNHTHLSMTSMSSVFKVMNAFQKMVCVLLHTPNSWKMIGIIYCGIKDILVGVALTIPKQNLAKNGHFNEHQLTFFLALGLYRAVFLPLWKKIQKCKEWRWCLTKMNVQGSRYFSKLQVAFCESFTDLLLHRECWLEKKNLKL